MAAKWYDTDEWFAPGTDDIRNKIKNYQVEIGQLQTKYTAEIAEYNKVQADFKSIYSKSKYLDEQVEQTLLAIPDALLAYKNKEIQTVQFFLNITGGVLGAVSLAAAVGKLFKAKEVIKAASSISRVNNLLKVGKVSAGLGVVLGIVSTALSIVSAKEQKKALEQNKNELKSIVNDLNTEIDTVNEATVDVVTALSQYFINNNVNYTGVFNNSQDGVQDLDLYDTAIKNLTDKLNASITEVGNLKAKMDIAVRMLLGGFSAEQVANLADLPLKTVQELQSAQTAPQSV